MARDTKRTIDPTSMDGFTVEDTAPETAHPLSDIINAVECEYMVYGTFRERFEALEARRDYAGTHLYVPCANGQIVRVTVRTLSKDETVKYWEGEAP